MAIEVSITGKASAIKDTTFVRDSSPGQTKGRTDAGLGIQAASGQTADGAAARVIARLMVAFSALVDLLLQAFERIVSAQARAGRRKQMKLVESLPLGNRRQLLLIDCGNQRYLVGAGADSVGSILAMDQGSASGDLKAKGPELVRRNGQAAAENRRTGAATEAGPALWR